MLKEISISLAFIFSVEYCLSQKSGDSIPGNNSFRSEPNKQRIWLVAGGNFLLFTGSFIALNQAWYADYPKTSFHFFNDNKEWKQMDKVGHVWTNYQLTRLSTEMWKWTGLNAKKSLVLAGITSMAYQSIIEIQDGYSSQWGFSWGDMLSNVVGSVAFIIQDLSWREQRIQIKFSYWPYEYNSPELVKRRNDFFGSGTPERILKDYNSQTYWLSTNMRTFFPANNFPKWLNIAFGYSADGMFGGRDNKWTDKEGNTFIRDDIPRVRRFYLSPDIDLTKIKTRSRVLKSVFFIFNSVKVPAPALELSSKGNLKIHAVYF